MFGLLLSANILCAQEIQDTTVYIVAKGEDIRISLAWTNANHGLIQWQVYSAGTGWTDIPGAIIRNLKIKADTNAFFRAKVVSGTCDPLFSSVTGLNVLNIRTLLADSITDTHAVVFCSADTSAGGIAEQGVLIDTRAIPDSTSPRVKDTSGGISYHIQFHDLVPGKKYYVRAYEKLGSGKLLLGNILDFTTYKIEAVNRVNLTDSTATVWYSITGDTASITHGIFYGTATADTNSLSEPGIPDGNKWKSFLDRSGCR